MKFFEMVNILSKKYTGSYIEIKLVSEEVAAVCLSWIDPISGYLCVSTELLNNTLREGIVVSDWHYTMKSLIEDLNCEVDRKRR